MTLCEAFQSFAADRHAKTLRPFLAYRVGNAANTNNRTATLSRACAAGLDTIPLSSPNPITSVLHDAPHSEFGA